MGYFAGPGGPVGAVGPDPVTAIVLQLPPAMARRALPDAWTIADPGHVWRPDGHAAARALRRVDPRWTSAARHLVPVAARPARRGPTAGRALFAANRALGEPDDPVEALW